MPAPANNKDNPGGDMAPFIIFMAFVILTTVIIISLYRINTEEKASSGMDDSGFTIALDAREPIVFSDDFLFPGFFPVSGGDGLSRPNIQQDVVEVRRLLTDGKYERAEDMLRTLFPRQRGLVEDDMQNQIKRIKVFSDLIAKIAASPVHKILYISCNPATLTRDLVLFRDGGFVPGPLQPVDLFPRTAHVETVVLLSRK